MRPSTQLPYISVRAPESSRQQTYLMAADALVLEEAVELLHAVQFRPAALVHLPDVRHEQLQLLAAELVEGHQLRRHRHREPARPRAPRGVGWIVE